MLFRACGVQDLLGRLDNQDLTVVSPAIPASLELLAIAELRALSDRSDSVECRAVRALPAPWVLRGPPVLSVRQDLPVRKVQSVRRESQDRQDRRPTLPEWILVKQETPGIRAGRVAPDHPEALG